jgi:hypothetical protein
MPEAAGASRTRPVEAQVTPLGLATVTRRLDPVVIAGAITYGNYFTMRLPKGTSRSCWMTATFVAANSTMRVTMAARELIRSASLRWFEP